MAPLEHGIPRLAGLLDAAPGSATAAAEAILTTDTVRKEAIARFDAGGAPATVGGMAKGAAMLSPAMATMLAVLTTDALVAPDVLAEAITRAVEPTFNALIVDGCTSTNDTVLVLAGGRAGNAEITGGPARHALTDALTAVCADLAEQMARDAEGASRMARITVRGARSDDEARRAARAVARSQLVQCSLNGADPYWGRVLAELGASGSLIDPEQVTIAYNGVMVCRSGIACPHDEAALAVTMQEPEVTIDCDLHLGRGRATVLTTDLSHAYIDENRGTS